MFCNSLDFEQKVIATFFGIKVHIELVHTFSSLLQNSLTDHNDGLTHFFSQILLVACIFLSLRVVKYLQFC